MNYCILSIVTPIWHSSYAKWEKCSLSAVIYFIPSHGHFNFNFFSSIISLLLSAAVILFNIDINIPYTLHTSFPSFNSCLSFLFLFLSYLFLSPSTFLTLYLSLWLILSLPHTGDNPTDLKTVLKTLHEYPLLIPSPIGPNEVLVLAFLLTQVWYVLFHHYWANAYHI